MRLSKPRIQPLCLSDATPEQREFLKPYETPAGVLNIYKTMAQNLDAARGFHAWGGYVLRRSKFNGRLREIVVLRIGWLCKSGYEWTQHSRVGKREGLTDVEIERIKLGSKGEGWTALERLLLDATDELHKTYFVTDATWAALGTHLSDEERMNFVFIAAHYTQVCMILNTFGIQVEDGVKMDEALRA